MFKILRHKIKSTATSQPSNYPTIQPFKIWLLVFCFAFGKSMAQEATATLEAWQAAQQSLVLLQNEGKLLPVKKLDKTPIFWKSYGMDEGNAFEATLAKYTDPLPPAPLAANGIFILALNAENYATTDPGFKNLEIAASVLKGQGKLVAVLFGKPSALEKLELFRQADALILVPENNAAGRSLAAQVIFGGAAANGKLETDIGTFYKKGAGLSSPGNLRLGYAPPQSVGLDAQLLTDSISAIVEEGIRAHAYPGAQVLVAKDGKVVFHKTYGYHTYDSLQAVQPTDIYDFASVTKTTSTLPALMRLNGEGRFDLDAPLNAYFPFYKNSNKAHITYREFLAHYGRLQPSIVFWREAKNKRGRWKMRSFKNKQSKRYPIRITDNLFLYKKYKKKIYKGIAKLPLTDSLSYVYSDLSFILYPEVVERLTGDSLEAHLKNTFYRPLGANTLTYNPLRFFPKKRIVPTERDTFFRHIQVHGTVHDETAAMLGGVSGHAGLFGSANDLAKLIQMYLNDGTYGGERFIKEGVVKEFARCQYCGKGNRRGLGFDKPLIDYDPAKSYVAKSASPESFGHSGYTGTFYWADPKYDLQVIFFSNRVYPDRSSRGLYDLDIRPRFQQAVYDAMKKR